MSKDGVNVQLSVKEIYSRMCPKCKKALRTLIKERLTDELVEKVVGEV